MVRFIISHTDKSVVGIAIIYIPIWLDLLLTDETAEKLEDEFIYIPIWLDLLY